MKIRLLATSLSLAIIIFCSCNGQKSKSDKVIDKALEENSAAMSLDEDQGKKGNFKVDDKIFVGEVTTQHFGATGKQNFSVLCQQDREGSSFALLQITFVIESDARGSKELKLYDEPMLPMTDPQPGIVTVVLTGYGEAFGEKEFSGTSTSTGNVSVSNNTITLKNLKLFNQEKKEVTINAEIPF